MDITSTSDTPNKQSGSFTITKTKPGVYAYKVYLSNNAGESCSANFNVRLIEQSMDVSKTSGTDNTEIAIYPLLPEGDIDLRPGKPM